MEYQPVFGSSRTLLLVLRTFLVYAKSLKHEDAHQLGSLVSDMEAGFRESKRDFTSIHRIERSRENLDTAVSRLQDKLMVWRPQIKAAFGSFESHSDSQSPLGNYARWMCFAYLVVKNIQDMLTWNRRIPPMVLRKLEALEEMLWSVIKFVQVIYSRRVLIFQRGKFRNLLTQFGAGLVRTASLCYLCLVDITNDSDERMVIVLSDLMMTIKPRTPQVIEGYLEELKALQSAKNLVLSLAVASLILLGGFLSLYPL
ncbi:OLC1v1031566C1 [Oldenlandia corymbosa var. corymbosa]|uniref:OLC1v1031566C1 n=1 Tax=Oldenlandia corymbosa var. corymbosa TaxID=529605 RepID=A0AAV1CLM5_OLDCO|nr:OLC1v1031566C1 [Oldenlandia corymbosa var. corymbosa]